MPTGPLILKNWLANFVSRWPYRFRYGHAFPSESSTDDPLDILLRLMRHGHPIAARDPTDVAAVNEAEEALGHQVRPVYAYVGDLHPKLGRAGLIISDQWYRRKPLGVSKCDTGGLIGLHGGFGCLNVKGSAKDALRRLTPKPKSTWSPRFRIELFRSHGGLDGWEHYLWGHAPSRPLKDVRDTFIKSVVGDLDRRLWTWEARGDAPIERGDVCAVVLATEAGKLALQEARDNPETFGTIQIIVGAAAADGVKHFDEEEVVLAFMGR